MSQLLKAPLSLGAFLLVLGGSVLAGHAARKTPLVQWWPGQTAMVIDTAVAIVLCGSALLLCAVPRPWARQGVVATSTLLLTLALWGLLQSFAGMPALWEQARAHAWIHDGSPRPGLMSAATALGLAAAGAGFMALRSGAPTPARAMTALSMAAALLVLGLAGLVGQALGLDLFYARLHSGMAAHTALAMVVLACGMWLVHAAEAPRRRIRPEQRIVLAGVLTLVVLGTVAGLAGFVALKEHAQSLTSSVLVKAIEADVRMLKEGAARSRVALTMMGAERSLVALVDDVLEQPGATVPQQRLGQWLRDHLGNGASAQLEDSSGRVIAAWQSMPPPDALAAPFEGGELVWDGGYKFRHVMPGPAARLVVVQALPEIDRLFLQPVPFGRSAELRACMQRGQTMHCFPQHQWPQVRRVGLNNGGPMHRATRGEHGLYAGLDYRGRSVIAAHAPLSDTGLGLVLKQDSAEIFAPIAQRLAAFIPILVGLCAAGAWLLRQQVRPLAAQLVGSQQRLQTILGHVCDGIITVGADGTIQDVNRAACALFGHDAGEMLGRPVTMLLPPHPDALRAIDPAGYVAAMWARAQAEGLLLIEAQRKDASRFTLELGISSASDRGGPKLIGVMRDVSEPLALKEALQAEKERLRVTLHSIGDAVICTDMRACVSYLNPVAEQLTGWRNDEAAGRPAREVFRIIDAQTGQPSPCPVDLVLGTGRVQGLAALTELARRDGTRVAIEDSAAPIVAGEGRLAGVVVVFHDVTEARRLSAQISHQASHDALTDVYNRREFERRLMVAAAAATPERPAALLFVDLDRFKIVNDSCGHVAGDELLKQVALRLRSCLRADDTLARLGGDEFAMILANCPREAALRVAEALRGAVCELGFTWDGKAFSVGASIGVVHSDGRHSMADLLKAADSACYAAKERGRNRVHEYADSEEDAARRSGESNWVARIERALQEGQLELHAQRIAAVCTDGAAHDCFELLVRLREDDGRLVPPLAFIPAAERHGLMPRIDRWVIERAFALLGQHGAGRQALAWAINLSATSINQEGFLDHVRDQIERHHIEPSRVTFEITETSAMTSITQSGRAIRELKALGFGFAVDDFGSGIASFSHMKHLPVDLVKIDGSFVKNVDHDAADREIVASIHRMARVMGIRTVAKSVETDAVLACLRGIGVDYAQGYGIGRPLPIDQALAA
jgi:diguanylate cyclase (GGDEF)-like protein/PAS domain S-box-containing protein